ncbi:MAG: chemotaxis protein CheW [Spirochaetes bacterium]|nr:chemotaxis protein CheW [Spirochaetota bacterium]
MVFAKHNGATALVVAVNGMRFTFAAENVIAIVDKNDIEVVPAMPPSMAGILYYNDQAVPVSRLNILLGLKYNRCDKGKVIIFEFNSSGCYYIAGIVVDAVLYQTVCRTNGSIAHRPPVHHASSGTGDTMIDPVSLLSGNGICAHLRERELHTFPLPARP